MTDQPQHLDGDNRASHIRAMRQQLQWLETEAARLKMKEPLIHNVIDSLRQRIKKLEAEERVPSNE